MASQPTSRPPRAPIAKAAFILASLVVVGSFHAASHIAGGRLYEATGPQYAVLVLFALVLGVGAVAIARLHELRLRARLAWTLTAAGPCGFLSMLVVYRYSLKPKLFQHPQLLLDMLAETVVRTVILGLLILLGAWLLGLVARRIARHPPTPDAEPTPDHVPTPDEDGLTRGPSAKRAVAVAASVLLSLALVVWSFWRATHLHGPN